MPLVLNSSSITGLAAVGGLSSPQTGSVLQVVSATTSTPQTIATTSYTDLSGLSITITPTSSTSKFLLMYSVHANFQGNGRGFAVRFVRNGTALHTPSDRLELYSGVGGDLRLATSNQYLDSPSTASAITYKLQAASFAGADGVIFSASDVQNTFTVMEIAA